MNSLIYILFRFSPAKRYFIESKLLHISLLSVIEVEPNAHQPNILKYLQKNSSQIQQKSLTSAGKTPLV